MAREVIYCTFVVNIYPLYMTKVEIKCPLVHIAAGVNDFSCFIAFYFFDPYSNSYPLFNNTYKALHIS